MLIMYNVLFKVLSVDLGGFLRHDIERYNNRETLDPSSEGKESVCIKLRKR